MKKGFFKTFAAIATAAVMSLGTAATALASSTPPPGDPTSGVVIGSGEFSGTVLSVRVPTDVTFPIDNLGLNSTPTEFVVYNRTAAPVLVSYDLTLEIAEDVAVGTPGQIEITIAQGPKEIALGLLGAKDISGSATTPGQIDNLTWTFATKGELADANYATSSQLALFTDVATSGEAVYKAYIDFALGTGTGTLADSIHPSFADNDLGVGAFSFYAETSNSAWTGSDVSVRGVYNLTPLHADVYRDIITSGGDYNKFATVTQIWLPANVRPEEGEGAPIYDNPGFIVDGDTVTTYNGEALSVAVDGTLSIPFYHNDWTLKLVKIDGGSGTTLTGSELGSGNTFEYYNAFTSTGIKNIVFTLTDGDGVDHQFKFSYNSI